MSERRERAEGEELEGRYRLLERLGRGGFGDVWRAEELLPDGSALRQVALKLLHASLAEAADWSAEARIIASLRHPALVTIYAAGVLALERTTPYVAMELLVGTNLDDFVERGRRVRWRRVLAWARDTAAALDVIHKAGVVHLDLKPANLFLPEEGGIKVLDFGIARQGRGDRDVAVPESGAGAMSTAAFMMAHDAPAGGGGVELTSNMTRSVVGTPGFMAPEVFEDGEPGPATDAYALAACIVLLCTGKLPQQVGGRPDVAPSDGTKSTQVQAWISSVQAATVRGLIRDLTSDHPELPAALTDLLMRWLALDPAARGIEPGSMRAQLQGVWRRPYGTSGPPYRGLGAYTSKDEGRLYGRGPEVRRLVRELEDEPCLVLHGASGIGLSSLVLAGVVPELGRSFADDRDDWIACAINLDGDRDPDDAVKEAFRALARAEGIESQLDDVEAFVGWAANASVGVVVVVDDLHRVLVSREDGRVVLGRLLAHLVEPHAGVRLVGILKDDRAAALVELDGCRSLRPWLRFMSGMQPNLARELVFGPVPDLGDAERVVGDVQAELGDDARRLPCVALALTAWWDRLEDQRAGNAAWLAIGGVAGPLCRHADTVMGALGKERMDVAQSMLLRLVSIDGVGIAVDEAQLAMGDAEHRAVLEQLCRARLVVEQGGKFRLGHPALADRWKWLHERRLHDMDRLALMEELRQATRHWLDAGRPRRATWGKGRLRAVAAHGAAVEQELTDDEKSFLDASNKALTLAMVIRVVVAACLVAAAAIGVWFDRRLDERAREQQRSLETARTTAAINHMVTRSRRTDDPYVRVALLSGAIELGSTDPMLSLELLAAAKGMPPARFLSLERVIRPQLPWGERWLLGGSGNHAVVYDFKSAEGFGPMVHRFHTHAVGMHDFVPVPFDTAFVSRGLDGQLKVWRLRETGQIALATASPMKCLRGSSAVLVASRAPVVGCATSEGLALWDLREPGRVATDRFQGRVLDIAPDGSWLGAARLRKVLMWRPADGRRVEIDMATAPSLARFSPRDALVALVWPGTIEIHDLATDPPQKRFGTATYLTDPVEARWSDGGLDLAVCNHEGDGEWYYLREGGRHADDGAAPAGRRPCRVERSAGPKPLDDVSQYGERFSRRNLGPRSYEGGWRLHDDRTITRDLVMFDPADTKLERLVGVEARPRKDTEVGPGDSAAMVARDGERAVWQVGADVRVHDVDGSELMRREGRLLALCPNQRALAWRVEGSHWRLFGVKEGLELGRIARRPGFVLGIDPSCSKLLLQWHDGQLAWVDVDGDRGKPLEPRPLAMPSASTPIEGYVYDVRPSKAAGVGLWLAFSGGAIVRFDAGGAAGTTAYGLAAPRVTAMADGPRGGELLFADDTGLVLRAPGVPDTLVVTRQTEREWEDIMVLPDRRTVALSWAHGVELVDLESHTVIGEIALRSRGRLAKWDDEGSLLVWPFSFMGEPRGEVIPVGRTLVQSVASAASNLRAKLGPDRQPVIDLE